MSKSILTADPTSDLMTVHLFILLLRLNVISTREVHLHPPSARLAIIDADTRQWIHDQIRLRVKHL